MGAIWTHEILHNLEIPFAKYHLKSCYYLYYWVPVQRYFRKKIVFMTLKFLFCFLFVCYNVYLEIVLNRFLKKKLFFLENKSI